MDPIIIISRVQKHVILYIFIYNLYEGKSLGNITSFQRKICLIYYSVILNKETFMITYKMNETLL